MTTVTFFYENGVIVKVRAAGHSGYAEHGSDVVCAATSTLVQTAYLAVKDLGVETEFVRDEKKGLFQFAIAADCDKRHDVDVILRALLVGLEDLRGGYPQYVSTKIEVTEV